jgi:hypothetical protein
LDNKFATNKAILNTKQYKEIAFYTCFLKAFKGNRFKVNSANVLSFASRQKKEPKKKSRLRNQSYKI